MMTFMTTLMLMIAAAFSANQYAVVKNGHNGR